MLLKKTERQGRKESRQKIRKLKNGLMNKSGDRSHSNAIKKEKRRICFLHRL